VAWPEDLTIQDLGLSTQTHDLLVQLGLRTIGDLLSVAGGHLSNLPIPQKSVDELKARFDEWDIPLAP
jgi:hypothetical protein